MKARELILLSPYRYPAGHALSMGDEDMAAWMNTYTTLWHPAILWGAAGPPRVDSPYDYENPQDHHVYGVPESPPLMMSEDWPDRVKQVGGVILYGMKDRLPTLEKAREILASMTPGPFPQFNKSSEETNPTDESFNQTDAEGNTTPSENENPPASETGNTAVPETPPQEPEGPPSPSAAEVQAKLAALEDDKVRPFFAIGLGYLLLESLSEAMEHENLLQREVFWDDIQRALAELAGVPYPKAVESESFQITETPPEEEPSLFPDEPAEEFLAGESATDQTKGKLPLADAGFEEFAEATPGNAGDYPEGGQFEDSYSGYQEQGNRDSYFEPAPVEPWYAHLQAASQQLLSAREVLYPVTIYLLDLFLPDAKHLDNPWPASFAKNIPLNVIAPTSLLEQLRETHPERFQELRQKLERGEAEVCGGCYLEREDNLLPVESQLWNLLKGQSVARKLLGRPIEVFARKKFFAHPQLPLFLSTTGLNRGLLVCFDDSAGPQFRSTVVSWPSSDGKQLDAFVRTPFRAESMETFFNLGHNLHKTIRDDHSATLAFLHTDKSAAPWYEDFLELGRFGPIFGEWKTFTQYFNEAMTGEYTSSHSADEFHFDYLSARIGEAFPDTKPVTAMPVSGFSRHLRLRRRLEMCWTLAAMQRGLAGRNDPLNVQETLAQIEDKLEREGPNFDNGINELREGLLQAEKQILQALADRLLSRATGEEPGYLLLNPCSFIRRVALELEGATIPLPIRDPVKACQMDGEKMLLVAEIPALGFAWLPKAGPEGTPPPTMRMRLADDKHVRNEFFEIEIDPQTGGFRSLMDRRNPVNRLSQRLVFNPGSTMQATSIKVTSSGPALGEVVCEGALLGLQQQVLAKFRQRFRAWLGRPVLEMRIEIFPEQPAAGYGWHAYYGCRFAWGDERAMLLRGVNGISYVTTHLRPQTLDFVELRSHRHNTVIFPGGLPFLRRHENRMLDVILIPQGETVHTFDLAVALDREYPMQTALGLSTPVPMIETAKGPPHIGAKGWLYHLDTPHLVMTSMRPGGMERRVEGFVAPGEEGRDLFDAMTVRLMECGSQSGQAEFRCVRNPKQAVVLDARGERLLESNINDDTVYLEVTPNDFNQVQIEFS